jgi:hypothetical protein
LTAVVFRVARCYIFRPKIAIWVNFGWSCNWRCRYTYFMDIWSILRPFLYIFHGHLVYFGVIWSIFPNFGILYQEKSGNPACDPMRCERRKDISECRYTHVWRVALSPCNTWLGKQNTGFFISKKKKLFGAASDWVIPSSRSHKDFS